jgi:hypothetical protein
MADVEWGTRSHKRQGHTMGLLSIAECHREGASLGGGEAPIGWKSSQRGTWRAPGHGQGQEKARDGLASVGVGEAEMEPVGFEDKGQVEPGAGPTQPLQGLRQLLSSPALTTFRAQRDPAAGLPHRALQGTTLARMEEACSLAALHLQSSFLTSQPFNRNNHMPGTKLAVDLVSYADCDG